jgi:hypothetical protein
MFFETLESRELFSTTLAPTPTDTAPSSDTASSVTYDNTANAKKPPHKPLIVIIAILIG